MKRFDNRLLWGLLLILAGVFFLLQNLAFIPNAWGVLWGVFFAAAGLIFLYAYSTDRAHWWPLIPGISLLGLAVLTLGESFFTNFSGQWGGAIFLGGIALAFWAIYLFDTEMWWAIIPAGVLSTLAVVTVVDVYLADAGFVFFLGLAATFGLVGVVPTSTGRMTWAFIPAAVLFVLALLTSSSLQPFINYLWPVALIILGAYFILRNLR